MANSKQTKAPLEFQGPILQKSLKLPQQPLNILKPGVPAGPKSPKFPGVQHC